MAVRVKVFSLCFSMQFRFGAQGESNTDLELLSFEVILKSFISLDTLVEEENVNHSELTE